VTAVIAYDKSVKNFIDALSDTGHVTHTAYKKKSVTIHHNGGRLSHEGVLQVWKTRPASAHFNVDAAGTVAQYVKVNEYAWAVGNTRGNQETVSIEMCNEHVAPTWQVREVTWKSAARLAGWLFFKVIGQRPSKDNLFYHHHWKATLCAGPFMDKVYPDVLLEAEKSYDLFKSGKPSTPAPATPKPTVPGSALFGVGDKGEIVKQIQKFFRVAFPGYKNSVSVLHTVLISVDSDFGPQTEAWVKEFQKRTGLKQDGVVGPQTFAKMRAYGYVGRTR